MVLGHADFDIYDCADNYDASVDSADDHQEEEETEANACLEYI